MKYRVSRRMIICRKRRIPGLRGCRRRNGATRSATQPLDKDREAWFVYGEPNKRLGIAIVHGALPDRAKSVNRWEDVPRIAYVPAERIKAMDQDGVDTHTLFGNIAGVAGGTFSNPSLRKSSGWRRSARSTTSRSRPMAVPSRVASSRSQFCRCGTRARRWRR